MLELKARKNNYLFAIPNSQFAIPISQFADGTTEVILRLSHQLQVPDEYQAGQNGVDA